MSVVAGCLSVANPVWPESLPPPLTGQAGYEPAVENVLTTGMDTGAPKRRRRFTRVPEKFSTVIQLDAAQYLVLKDFTETVLKDVGAFDWVDWRTDAVQTYYFTARPKYQHVANSVGLWQASLELMTI